MFAKGQYTVDFVFAFTFCDTIEVDNMCLWFRYPSRQPGTFCLHTGVGWVVVTVMVLIVY